jgi:hypothetical protein
MDINNDKSDLSVDWYAKVVVLWMQERELKNVSQGGKIDDIPRLLKEGQYVLEINYKVANKIMKTGIQPINLNFLASNGVQLKSDKNAYKLPSSSVLRDIDGNRIVKKGNQFLKTSDIIIGFLHLLFGKIKESLKQDIKWDNLKDAKMCDQNPQDVFIFSFPTDAEKRNQIIDKIASITFDIDEITDNGRNPLFEDAAFLIVAAQQGTASLLQRRLKLDYDRANIIIDQMEAAGIVGPFEGRKHREVKFASDSSLEQFLKDLNIKDGSHRNPIYDKNFFNYIDSLPFIDKSANRNFFGENKVEIEKRIAEKKQIKQVEKLREIERQEKEVIKKKLLEREHNKRLHEEARAELFEKGELFRKYGKREKSREHISQEIMDQVWNRDGGRCVMCGSQENLEFDHIIPHSKGGAATYRNLQILCKSCNIQKSNKIGD